MMKDLLFASCSHEHRKPSGLDVETGLANFSIITYFIDPVIARRLVHRRDVKLGSYSIWHDRFEPTLGKVVSARFDLLDRLGLATSNDLSNLHSVLMLKHANFTVYLPPKIVKNFVTSGSPIRPK